MSGAAALSAAKNRRSGGATNSVSKPSTPQSKNQQNQNNLLPADKKEPLHPLRVLQKHELILKKHDEELETLISINNENKTMGSVPSIENIEITKKLNDLEKAFNTLHNDFDNVKKEINKVMSFSIGINNEIMNLKKEMNKKIEFLKKMDNDNEINYKEELEYKVEDN